MLCGITDSIDLVGQFLFYLVHICLYRDNIATLHFTLVCPYCKSIMCLEKEFNSV